MTLPQTGGFQETNQLSDEGYEEEVKETIA